MDASQPMRFINCVRSALAVEENSDTDGKFIHAPSFFVFLVLSLLFFFLVVPFFSFVLFSMNEFGTFVDYDAIYPAFSFEMEDRPGVTWHGNSWGRIKFDDIVIGE